MKKLLLLGAVFTSVMTTAPAQRISGLRDLEAGIVLPVGYVPTRPARGYLSVPYLESGAVKIKGSEGIFTLATTTAAASVGTRPVTTRFDDRVTFAGSVRFKKAALPVPPAGHYSVGVDTDGKLKLRTATTLYTVLHPGGTTPEPTNCSVSPVAIVGTPSAYQVGGNYRADLDWAGGTAPFTVQVKNSVGNITFTRTGLTNRNSYGNALTGGSNTLLITDVNGCTAQLVLTAGSAPSNPCSTNVLTLVTPLTAYTANALPQVDVNWTAGTANFNIQVKNASNVVVFSRADLTERNSYGNVLAPGQQNTVIVTDANGCTAQANVTAP